MPMSKRIQVWFPDEIVGKIKARGSDFSDSIRESLSRYYALIEHARQGLEGRFTPAELGVIIDTSNSTLFEAHSIQGILFNVQDCAPDGTWEKWGANEEELIAKLESLTLTEHAALVDAVERWWQAVGHGFQPEVSQLLKEKRG